MDFFGTGFAQVKSLSVVSLVHVVELLENYLSWMGLSAEA